MVIANFKVYKWGHGQVSLNPSKSLAPNFNKSEVWKGDFISNDILLLTRHNAIYSINGNKITIGGKL